jgi:hypothetical protein
LSIPSKVLKGNFKFLYTGDEVNLEVDRQVCIFYKKKKKKLCMTANEYNFYPLRNILKRRNFKIENAMAVIYSLTFKGVLFILFFCHFCEKAFFALKQI